MAWTDEMVEGLRQMWDEGLTANEIAKRLGVSKNSIVGKVHRLCLKARPSPIKRKDVVEETVVDNVQEVVPETEVVVEKTIEVTVKKNKKSEKNGNIKLVELDSHTCRWPLGDPRDDDFCFCGKKIRLGQTYCDEHSTLDYVKAIKK